MSFFEYKTHISATGEVAPIPDWPGGEADATLRGFLPDTEKEQERRSEALRQFMELRGGSRDAPGKELISKKQIRAMRLEERYGEKTLEERQANGKIFYEMWDGALEGMPDMTAKEIRAERLEKKHGQ